MSEKSIYDLELHEAAVIRDTQDAGIVVMRTHHGWVYTSVVGDETNQVFVPDTRTIPPVDITPEFLGQLITSLDWLTTDAKVRFDDCRDQLEDGSQGGYSPELTRAIEQLATLKRIAK